MIMKIVFSKYAAWTYANGSYGEIIAQFPKCRRSIEISGARFSENNRSTTARNAHEVSLEGTNRFFLAFPDTMFYIRFNTAKQCHENSKFNPKAELPLTVYRDSLTISMAFIHEEKIYLPMLPNVRESLSVCLGMQPTFKISNEEQFVKDVVGWFWTSRFSTDIICNLQTYAKSYEKALTNFKVWQAQTKADPDWYPGPKNMIKLKHHDYAQFGYL